MRMLDILVNNVILKECTERIFPNTSRFNTSGEGLTVVNVISHLAGDGTYAATWVLTREQATHAQTKNVIRVSHYWII